MKILAITDIHGAFHNLKKIPETIITESNLIVLSGDITHFGYRNDADKIISYIETLNENIIAVAGNCDNIEVEDYLMDKACSIHKQIATKNGLHFLGISGSLPCPNTTPNEYREEDLEIYLECIKNDPFLDEPFILVSHQPPFGTINDTVSENLHVGSPSLREFIEEKQPLVCLTGHIHEGIGKDTIGEAIIVNPGPLASGKYAVLDVDETGVHKIELKTI